MRRLYELLERTLRDVARGHFSTLLEQPLGRGGRLLLSAAHRLLPSFTLENGMFPPYERVLFLFGRRDIEEVLDRDDVFSAREYDARMKASSGAFFLGMDETSTQYRPERTGSDAAIGKVPGQERSSGEGAYQKADLEKIDEIVIRTARKCVQGARDAAKGCSTGRIDVAKELADIVPIALLDEYFGITEMAGPDGKPLPGTLRKSAQSVAFHIFNFFATSADYAGPATLAGGAVHEHLAALVRLSRSDGRGRDTVLGRMAANTAVFKTEHDVARTLAGVAIGGIVPGIGSFLHAVARLLELDGTLRAQFEQAARDDEYEIVLGYMREGARFAPYPPTIYRMCLADHTLGVGTVHERRVEKGTLVVPVIIGAAFDPDFVHLPNEFIPRRDNAEYLLFGHGQHECLGTYIGEYMMTRMACELFKLPGLRRPSTETKGDSTSKVAPFGDELLLQFTVP
jgi:cytochrome P450